MICRVAIALSTFVDVKADDAKEATMIIKRAIEGNGLSLLGRPLLRTAAVVTVVKEEVEVQTRPAAASSKDSLKARAADTVLQPDDVILDLPTSVQ